MTVTKLHIFSHKFKTEGNGKDLLRRRPLTEDAVLTGCFKRTSAALRDGRWDVQIHEDRLVGGLRGAKRSKVKQASVVGQLLISLLTGVPVVRI